MSHWRKAGHSGQVKVIPEIKSNTLTEPSDKPLEDLLRMRGPWECEECAEMFPDSMDLLSHVRREHSGCHVSKLFARHVKSRRKYPLAMLFRHVLTCGVPDCSVFSARDCAHDNALLTQRKKLKILLNLLRHSTAGFMSGRLVLCTKINGRNLIQKLIYNVTIWISLVKLYQ